MFKEKFGMFDRMRMKLGKGFSDGLNLSMDREQNVIIKLFGPDGKQKDERRIHNTVKDAGKYGAAAQILATPALVKPGWMELGISTPGATLLGSHIAGSRVALTSKTRTNAIVTMVGDWIAGVGTGAITEAGVFDVVTENTVNMWLCTSFDVINKGDLDTLSVNWALTFG
jgi:hypothetical protein